MKPGDPEFTAALIACHLGVAETPERAAVESALHSSDEARRASTGMGRILRALASDTVEPPPDLAERVLRRIEAAQTTIRLPDPAAGLRRGDEAGGRSSPVIALRELLSLAAAVLVFVGVFLPGYHVARRNAQRQLCLDQMREVGRGFADYAAEHAGLLPYTGVSPNERWPVGGRSAPLPNLPNTMQVLLKSGYVQNRRSVLCPGESPEPGTATFYSAQHFVQPFRIEQLSPRFPIASDRNPLVREGMFRPADGLRNADVHGRNAGQNVLRVDGSAGWQTRPTVGVEGDDIFRIENEREYRGAEPLGAVSDAFLIP